MTHQIRVYGIVQGVGFRPTVARYAAKYGIRGRVSNQGPYVEILAEAESGALETFEEAIQNHSPERAVILKMDVTETEPRAFSDFSIAESRQTRGRIFIPPDIAVCDDCKKELYDKGGRRYLHPFINCTCCGPRLTILDALPYDRERTSMKAFSMCGPCSREYVDPLDRRYDAQPVCCNECGPVVYLLDLDKEQPAFCGRRYRDLTALSTKEIEEVRSGQRAAITRIRQTIAGGGIVAIKGIGGYHICCDATNPAAVNLLRERKRRPAKPFAVMMKDLTTVKKYCEVSPAEEVLLTGHQKPIVLLEKREDCPLASPVAPGNPKAGVMLPYAPVQMLLFDYEDSVKMPDALVMTSANTSGAPICRDEKDALRELGTLCDEILAHNRMIRIRADDTVVDFYRNRSYMIRRSRGYAPLPLMTERLDAQRKGRKTCVLAIGGELKNTFCVRVGDLAYLSPYVGDMEDIRTTEALRETVMRFLTLLEVTPEAIVCDLHPKYHTTQVAEELAAMLQVPLYRMQHHYAHVLSCIAENDEPDPVIGIAFDGTGYGEDGSIWGGEVLVADAKGYERAGFLRPFLQVGGDASAREGWRIAVSMIDGLKRPESLREIRELDICTEQEAKVIQKMADAGINAVRSTSCGRLFDAVSAMLGIKKASTFEGEASMALQYAAQRGRRSATEKSPGMKPCPPVEEGGTFILPTDRLFADLLQKKLAGANPDRLAYAFHAGLAEQVVGVCLRIQTERGLGKVALTGGCFQNTLLLELTEDRLLAEGFTVLRHSRIPPNDGGLALGQAAWMLPDEQRG